MPLTPYVYKMCAKLKVEGLQCLSLPHTMLAHWWKNSSACWCKHLKTFITRRINMFIENRYVHWESIVIKTIFCLSYDYYYKLARKNNHKTKWTRMGLIMTMSANMQTPLTDSTMLIRQREDCKVKGRRTWVYSMKHEILHFLQWQQKHLTPHNVKSSSPQVPTCGHHWLIAQCQFDNVKITR